MVNILGFDFLRITKSEYYKKIKETINAPRHTKIFTPNPSIIINALRDADAYSALKSADLLLPDGIGIIIASAILKKKIPQRICGIDAGEYILEYAAQNNMSVYLLGAKVGVEHKAKKALQNKFQKLNICGTHHGYFAKEGKENDSVIRDIRDSKADIVFVCLGSPLQEKWIFENEKYLPDVRLFIGLGGSLDVWSGEVRRAPKFVQKICLEWLWRIIIEPQKIKRVADIPKFLYLVTTSKKKIAKFDIQ